MTFVTREIHLASRPVGWPTHDNFRLVETELPEPGPGQILVRNTVMSVDPYMRGRMNAGKSYIPPFAVDAPLEGGAVGEVIKSSDDAFAVGDMVVHDHGWREHAVVDAVQATPIDTGRAPASAYLGVLGMTGLTAYTGLVRIAELEPGDIVFVSGAAGAVGSAVGQIAQNLGAAKVIGSAGSPEKVRYLLDELGFDAAFDYHDGPVAEQLAKHAPDGIDVYFDNVGGEHLEGALTHMRDFGRLALCGSIASYNDDSAIHGPRNLGLAIVRRLKLQGFIVYDNDDLAGEFQARAAEWLANDQLTYQETYVDGLDHAVDALLDVFRGANLGKMLVRLAH
ncbi:NADP-dependent oxidoreductase [Streptomyces sp. NBC_00554]|uniref:NADP-dependent oxidoreductase n=1 Tax=unclassified Streptomyces TaxID=2593676 RepID=UPI00225B5765|nr:NADP-dependent oxidoreductase [Streptomyces sp. NBC_00620]MCX4977034.1 NADP-dependent oxidoreductase [Streptomyces sp. NBC_00620]WUC54667.1 NADP-dependent oxidoreductase [Streptomyces sp. NBC_00554]